MRSDVASVDDGVTKSLVGVIYAHLGAQTPSLAFLGPGSHLGKVLQIVLDTVVAGAVDCAQRQTRVRGPRRVACVLGRGLAVPRLLATDQQHERR